MDPNANYEEQLRIAKQIIEMVDTIAGSNDDYPPLTDRAARLAERVIELHEWRQRGGFLPEALVRPKGV